MKKIIYLLSYFMLMSIVGQAQHDHSRCGHTHINAFNQIHHPLLVQKADKIEQFTQNWIASNQHAKSGTVLQIPVVIHVVWNDPVENISDAQIQTQLDVLNDDFRKRNADTTFIPGVFQPLAADIEIEFVLAQRDTLGAPTTGINRIQTTIDEFGNFNPAALQAVPPWDTTAYLNIYICEITNGGFILGYATRPGMPLGGFDGIVMDYRYFGTIGTVQPPYDLGRTLTHEVGHYLNLLHIWGDNGGCSDDDLVNDTPSQEFPNYGCNTHPLNSCSSDDMFMNYMDYGDDPCLVMFTQGQKMRMLAALNGPRASLLTSPALAPDLTRLYVNQGATGLNNGDSWANAFTDLSDALSAADPTDTIWVAQGTYLSGGANPTRDSYFNIPTSVELYGGFDGTETTLDQRDVENNITILSGDLQNDDIASDLDSNKTDNTLHVMWADSLVDHTTIIDGFTIKGGYADIFDPLDETKSLGGGMLSYGTPLIIDCIFEDNFAEEGGALNVRNSTGVQVEDCAFLNNTADFSGGAIASFEVNGMYRDCYFEGNSAEHGGAVEVVGGAIEVVDCGFEENAAEYGGALSTASLTTPVEANITNCDFVDNTASIGGGAVNTSNSIINVMSSIFGENTSGESGGAFLLNGTISTITNSLIAKNTALGQGLGGAIHTNNYSELSIINTTIANNHGAVVDGIYQDFAEITIGNTILSHDNLNYGASDPTTPTVISLHGNVSSDSTLAHIFTHIADFNNTDPLFADTANNDFHLQQGSPAQDIGITSNAPMYDLDSLPRISHSDAGAYEYPFFVSTEEPTISLSSDVKVYPNPPIDVLTIEINNGWLGTVDFQLIDISGKVIRVWSSEKYGDLHEEQISTQALASGMYQIVLRNQAGIHLVRFIKL